MNTTRLMYFPQCISDNHATKFEIYKDNTGKEPPLEVFTTDMYADQIQQLLSYALSSTHFKKYKKGWVQQ